jgi:hypothetical protein
MSTVSPDRPARGGGKGVAALLRRQWEGYPRFHRSRENLLIHIVCVPLFLAGNIGLVVALVTGSRILVAASVTVAAVSLLFQGRGHALEQTPPEPFSGPLDAVARLFFEQWVTFPRFLLTGGWQRAFRA